MNERFSKNALAVMRVANQEALRCDTESIGAEHILLGLLKEGSGLAHNVIGNLAVDREKLRVEAERLVTPCPTVTGNGKLPLATCARTVVETALEEARGLNHNYVGTEHLLLGLIRVREGAAAQVLSDAGLTRENVRSEILNLLGPSDARTVSRPARRSTTIRIRLPGAANVALRSCRRALKRVFGCGASRDDRA